MNSREYRVIYRIKPKNYQWSLYYFFSVPFYTFKDFVFKKDILIETDEVLYKEKELARGLQTRYGLYLKNEKYEGAIEIQKNEWDKFDNLNVKEISVFRKFLQTYNYFLPRVLLSSPTFYTVLLSVFSWLVFIKGKYLLFPEIKNPELYVNSVCGSACVKHSALFFLVQSFVWFSVVGGFIVAFLFFIYAKKIKEIATFQKVFLESLILLLVNVCLMFNFFSITLQPVNIKTAHFIYQRRYNPDYFKKHNFREIASELKKERELIDFKKTKK